MVGAPKPMLAYKCSEEDLLFAGPNFPLFVQPKLDGVRALVRGGVVWGRSGKPIRNKRVQRLYGAFEGLDGELISGSPTAPDACRVTSGVLNSPEDETHVDLWFYDGVPPNDTELWPFHDRWDAVTESLATDLGGGFAPPEYPKPVETRLLHSPADVFAFESEMLDKGFEGIILRDPEAPYKAGRGSRRNRCLWALKRFQDDEGAIVGFVEEQANTNEATRDAFGRTERSSHKAGKVGKGTLGALVVESEKWTDTFEIGTGFTAHDREVMWAMREKLLGRKVKFKHFAHGAKDRPRHPVYLTLRLEEDLPRPGE
jgi:DNA ligase-1